VYSQRCFDYRRIDSALCVFTLVATFPLTLKLASVHVSSAFAACNSVSKLLPVHVDIEVFQNVLRDSVDVIGAHSPKGIYTAGLRRNDSLLLALNRAKTAAKFASVVANKAAAVLPVAATPATGALNPATSAPAAVNKSVAVPPVFATPATGALNPATSAPAAVNKSVAVPPVAATPATGAINPATSASAAVNKSVAVPPVAATPATGALYPSPPTALEAQDRALSEIIARLQKELEHVRAIELANVSQ
jgi:hypothetical protein